MATDKESENMLDHELRGPSTKTKKIIIIASLALVLLGIFAVVGMHYTSQPNFCASCHQIKPNVVSWSVGPHNDVTCLKCHADPGTVGYVKRKVVIRMWGIVKQHNHKEGENYEKASRKNHWTHRPLVGSRNRVRWY